MNMLISSIRSHAGSTPFAWTNKMVSGTITSSKSKKALAKKKKLEYNFKEISSMILRSKTSASARQAVSMAKSKVVLLRKRLGNDNYDSNELASAILHAEQMARAARKKLKHLRQEEMAQKNSEDEFLKAIEDKDSDDDFLSDIENYIDNNISDEDLMEFSREQLEEFIAGMQELIDELEEEGIPDELEELCEALPAITDNMDDNDLSLLKKKHRADELCDITKADMKYLKSMFDKLAKDRQAACNGVTLELGGTDVSVFPPEPVVNEGSGVDISV